MRGACFPLRDDGARREPARAGRLALPPEEVAPPGALTVGKRHVYQVRVALLQRELNDRVPKALGDAIQPRERLRRAVRRDGCQKLIRKERHACHHGAWGGV
eukprot:3971292-Prymnesium_polylepis.2